MSFAAVMKVGGSLSRGNGLPVLCEEIGRLGKRYALLIVPGGGDFAEQVREADRRFHLEATTAHRMALLAMDQYGYVLSDLIADSILTADLDCARESAESGRVAILLSSFLIMKEDPLPNSWSVTSDSIAAWLACRTRSDRLVLLKDVDGLLAAGKLIGEMTADQLASHSGGVDAYFSDILSAVSLEVWAINGLHPERLGELFNTGRTTGTRIIA